YGQATYAGLEGPPQAVAKQWRGLGPPEPRKARNKIGKTFFKINNLFQKQAPSKRRRKKLGS
ncbi:MAG: hypothetical protein II611_02980, partial [Treponema sp.]|nr:hypothetical protein [Treponema sp.]